MKQFAEPVYDVDATEEAKLEALFAAHDDEKNRRKARWESKNEIHKNGGRKKGGNNNHRRNRGSDYDYDDDNWN